MVFDLAVIGGGMGGLATAALAQRLGLRTILLEAHTRLGGCAGYFPRGPYTFDAGATALMGLGRSEPIGGLLEILGLELRAAKTTGYRLYLPDRSLEITSDHEEFERRSTTVMASDERSARAQTQFWTLQRVIGERLLTAASDIPRLPLRGISDLMHDLRILGIQGLLAAATCAITVDGVLRMLDLHRDRPFRAMIAMLLQDTAQAGPETVPFANAAAYLQAYRRGMQRPLGGMKALVEGIGQRFAELGGELRTASLVDRVERTSHSSRFMVVTRRRERIPARQVVFNLPIDLTAKLLNTPLEEWIARRERRSRPAWSAFTGYLVVRADAISKGTPLFHQVLARYEPSIHDGNNLLISLSPEGDEGYGPPDVRVVTIPTHTRPGDWQGFDRPAYLAKKAEFRSRFLHSLETALPGSTNAFVHEEFATPRSFHRYTRRTQGAVGGASVSRFNSNLMATPPDLFGSGLWLVGDSVFPGQGTLATTVSAIRVVERITGTSWKVMRDAPGLRFQLTSDSACLHPQP